MIFTQGDKVKLNARRQDGGCRMPVVLGQGAPLGGLFISEHGHEVFIPENRVMQVSEEKDLLLGDMDASPMPRISAELVNREALNERFSKVK